MEIVLIVLGILLLLVLLSAFGLNFELKNQGAAIEKGEEVSIAAIAGAFYKAADQVFWFTLAILFCLLVIGISLLIIVF